jgi:threonylcarbamoyladenosine tRNA methylthiotransferase MtaB
LQSGSNEILKAMNRPYKVEDFYKKIETLKDQDPNLAITTDCIVGFPGETKKDFNKTIEAVKKINFAKVHVFRYSPRPMTAAVSMTQDISEKEIKERSHELQAVAENLRNEFLESQTGKVIQVLGERNDNGYISGLSGNYIKIKFKGSENLLRKLVSVKINKVSDSCCFGEKL